MNELEMLRKEVGLLDKHVNLISKSLEMTEVSAKGFYEKMSAYVQHHRQIDLVLEGLVSFLIEKKIIDEQEMSDYLKTWIEKVMKESNSEQEPVSS